MRFPAWLAFFLLALATPAAAASAASNSCAALIAADFSQVEDAPGKVLSATIQGGERGLPAYCEVVGYAWRNVRFRVRMPLAGWNGKLVVLGTGGQAGAFMPDDPQS